ncbi:post-GPI attachment to proteins factor 6 isoform X2 [Latimeria chalumnae]|uniref:Post-GPI attachment to proteins 6 n=1 Tax=Latimeria chalumnae TaxID=7897 RepID=H3AVX5_LATCH|nr:PREDICTED: transmembrane protein 8A isoform X2 [Latimeria chalumnae]|eukprot:XP_006001515.1 PREDICTED: transmembrane protein 8A isoform X2 [Latimeria chalumnae]
MTAAALRGLVVLVAAAAWWAFLLPACFARRESDDTYVSEYFSQAPQRLSRYSWYGNVRLFYFKVPEDTVLVKWLLQASKGRTECSNVNITVYFRFGAPPIINPLKKHFAPNTTVHSSFNLTMRLTSLGQAVTVVNVSYPASGNWFIAAHLPKEDDKVEVKGFRSACPYLILPQMFVSRLVDMPVLESNVTLKQSVSVLEETTHLKMFIPEYTVKLSLQLRSCVNEISQTDLCPVQVILGPGMLPQSYQKVVNCMGRTECNIELASPPWEKWVQITVKSIATKNFTTTFEIEGTLTACKPKSIGSYFDLFSNFSPRGSSNNASLGNQTNDISLSMRSLSALGENTSRSAHYYTLMQLSGDMCLHNQMVLREQQDIVAVRFIVVNGPNVTVASDYPTLLHLNLNSETDSGGTIVLNLKLNKSSTNENVTVFACLSAASPVFSLSTTQGCKTAFSQGYSLNMNSTSTTASVYVPFPETDRWYLSMQIVCPPNQSGCSNLSAEVIMYASLSPCINDCGRYGECRLLRSYGYIYTACVCKAGWDGWSCTDDTHAQSYGRQVLATLLLTLSNLMFVPAIIVATYNYYVIEACVYLFTMFFSLFYHACDQPGIAVWCIMEYDALQYCDFLGSVFSIWVTILCMARLNDIVKYILFVIGSLFIAMSLQLDRRGIWNMLGPCMFALVIMVAMWVYRGVRRRQCYPRTWKRWVFYLLPGVGAALLAVAVYAFMETIKNYYYTHSIWHILVAGSVVFLLPPREEHKKPWAWSREFTWFRGAYKNKPIVEPE